MAGGSGFCVDTFDWRERGITFTFQLFCRPGSCGVLVEVLVGARLDTRNDEGMVWC